MTPAKRKIVRKHYFIKKNFQTKFFIGFVALLLIEAVLIAALFMMISRQTLTTGYSGSQFVIESTPSFFFVSFVILSVVVGVAVGLAGMLVFIFLSHRIAGPLYRFEKTLRELSEGNVASRINLRRTDQLTELQNALNVALGRFNDRLKEIKKEVGEAQKAATRNDKEKSMREIREILARIKEKINFFKTS